PFGPMTSSALERVQSLILKLLTHKTITSRNFQRSVLKVLELTQGMLDVDLVKNGPEVKAALKELFITYVKTWVKADEKDFITYVKTWTKTDVKDFATYAKTWKEADEKDKDRLLPPLEKLILQLAPEPIQERLLKAHCSSYNWLVFQFQCQSF